MNSFQQTTSIHQYTDAVIMAIFKIGLVFGLDWQFREIAPKNYTFYLHNVAVTGQKNRKIMKFLQDVSLAG